MSTPPPTEEAPPPAVPLPSPSSLFRDRNFVSLWMVSIAHNLGEKLMFVVLVSLGDLSNHSNTQVSAISLAFSLPAILFGSMVGVFADRFSLRGLMIASSLARAALILGIPFAGERPQLWPLMGFAFGFGFLTRFFDPAFMKSVPTVVRKEHLMAANSVFMTTMVAALIGSFALAGPIWALCSPRYSHLVIVGLYVVAAIAAFFIRFPKVAPASEESRTSFWEEWHFGLRYLRAHPRLLKAYTMTMTMFACFAALNVIAKGFAITSLETRTATDFTYILAVAGLGMVLGAGFLGRWGAHVPKPRLVRVGFVLAGAGMVLLATVGMLSHRIGLNTSWRLVYALALLIGMGGACIEIPVSTLVQEGVAPEVRGRIFGVQAMLMNLASTVPMALAGVLADLWGPAVVMVLLGCLMLGMSLFRLDDPAEGPALA